MRVIDEREYKKTSFKQMLAIRDSVDVWLWLLVVFTLITSILNFSRGLDATHQRQQREITKDQICAANFGPGWSFRSGGIGRRGEFCVKDGEAKYL